jgi:DNA polymerase I-like protein with 3'-5' exonuclease and polymerase domains
MTIVSEPPKLAGEVFDENQRLVGRYVYFQEGQDQELLDSFFSSWLNTYERNEDFFITLDLETTGLKPHEGKILLVSISWDGRNSIIFCPEYYNLDKFKEVLNTIPINNQNIKFDLKWLSYHYGTESKVYMDTMVCTQLGWPGVFPSLPQGTFGLGNIAKHLLSGYTLEKETRKEFIGMTLEQGFTKRQIEYAVKDSLITHKLVAPICVRLKNQNLWSIWENIEKPLIEVLVRTELKGVKVNINEVQRLLIEKEKELAEIYEKITQELKNKIPEGKMPKFPKDVFNPGSSQQIVNVLNVLNIKVMNTEKGTLQSAQAKYQNDLLGLIIEWKKVKGIISKFLTKWLTEHIDPMTQSIYTSFNTYGAETGRLSCKEPNMQQIPGDLRSMIIAREGYKILSMDYSQFEFRAAAAITEEDYLVSSFVERARLLPSVKNLALSYNFVDPDAFVKAVTKEKVNITDLQKKLVNEFALTDIHRRNAALILGKSVSDVTDKERSVGKCVSLDTCVHTTKGIYTIRELLPKRLKKDTYYDLKNVKVLTDEGYEESPTIYYNGKSPAIRITTKTGRSIVCTPTHRFRTINKSGAYVWIKAESLKVNSDIFLKLGAAYEGKLTKYPLGLKEEKQYNALAELVGITIREGTILGDTIVYSGDLDEKIRELLIEIGFAKTKINGPTKTNHFITVFRPEIVKWLESTTKIPSEFLHNCPKAATIALLKGLASDCQLGKHFRYEDVKILKDIQNLLLRFGINSYIAGKTMSVYNLPCLNIHGNYQELLKYHFGLIKKKPVLDEIKALKLSGSTKMHEKLIEAGFFGNPDEPKLTEAQQEMVNSVLTTQERDTLKFLIDNNVIRDTIVSITPVVDCEVADLNVPKNSTVVYEGFITHNTLGYAVLYGAGANRVQESLAKEGFYHSLSECKQFLDDFFNKLPRVEQFIKETHAKVLDPGYISTVMGRKRFFELPPKYLTRAYATQSEAAFREATNFCFQGANADATKKAMVLIDEAFRKYPEEVRPVLLLTVHDEVVAEVHSSNIDEVSELGQKIMVECGMESINFKTPVEVSQSIGDTWSK